MVYKAVLLAFALVVAGLIFEQLISLILAVLIVIVLALALSSFASMLQRVGVPRSIGAPLGLLLGLAAVGGLIALIIPAFSHEINRFSNSLPHIVDSLRHRIGSLTGSSPTKVGHQLQQFVHGYTTHPAKLLGPLESIGASIVAGLAALVVILLTALYTAIHPRPLVDGVVRLVPPSGRDRAWRILERLGTAYLGWLRGLAVGMVVLGGLTSVSYTHLTLPTN